MALAEAYVEIIADTRRFESGLKSKLSRAGNQAGSAFNKAFTKAASNMQVNTGFTASLTKRMGKDGNKAGKSFGAALLKGMAAPLTGIGKILSSVMDMGGGMGGTKGFAALGAAAVAATAALAPLAGFLAAIPAAIAGAGAAAATLAVAFRGVGTAISDGWSGDMAKFEESLKRLAPAAQTFARDVVGLKPALDGLKASVQGAFFGPLEGQMTKLSAVISGPLQAGMTNLAGALGEAASALVNFFASPTGAESLQQIFDGIAVSVREVTPGLMSMVGGFTRMAAVAAGSFGGLGDIFQKIGNAMTTFANSGQLNAMLTSAAVAADQLGQAFSGLWAGLQVLGSGPLATLGATMRAALIPAFTAIGQAMITLSPVINQIVSILGSVLLAVIPPVAAALTGLAQIVSALLGPALAVLGPIITQVVNTLGPVLTGVINSLVPMLTQLAAVVGPILGEAFRALGEIIKVLLPIVTSVFGAIVPVIQGALNIIIGAVQIFGGLLQGNWSQVLEGVKNIVKGAMDAIVGIFWGAIDIVVAAGRAIIDGFMRGVREAWNGAKGFFGGITDWIAQNKGPLPYDRRVLIPAGKAIMKGFNKGILSEWSHVAKTITGISRSVPKIAMPVNAELARAPLGSQRSALGAPETREQRTVEHNRTTTVNAPITVRSGSTNPAAVARRTADRLARLAIA